MGKINNGHLFLIICPKFSDLQENLNKFKIDFIKQLENKNLDYFENKITSNKYLDDYFLDASKGIKKEDIKNLIEQLCLPGIEQTGYKFYTIANVEQLNEYCYNSLLKFIENPPHQTIGFFSTKYPNKIPKTIVSRGQEIKLKPKEAVFDKNFFQENNIDANLIEKTFDSKNEIEDFKESKNFKIIISLFSSIKDLRISEKNAMDFLLEFKKLSQYEIKILLNFLYHSNIHWKQISVHDILEGNFLNINRTLLFNKIINLG